MSPSERGDDMELPAIARRIGTIDRKQIVYIEEYVLQYLRTYGCDESSDGERISLYGKHESREGVNVYIIYTACRETEEQEMADIAMVKQTEESDYEKIGYLHRRCHSAETDETNARNELVLTGGSRIGRLTGYYIFYHNNEDMKDYLARQYENQLGQARRPLTQQRVNGRLYTFIRMAALCIIIIFCIIAITTINAPGKMDDFVQTIMQTSTWAENESEGRGF